MSWEPGGITPSAAGRRGRSPRMPLRRATRSRLAKPATLREAIVSGTSYFADSSLAGVESCMLSTEIALPTPLVNQGLRRIEGV